MATYIVTPGGMEPSGRASVMTPDGITSADWDRVAELALELSRHVDDEGSDEYRNRLLLYLDTLESKYGQLPSILATRADFWWDEQTATKEDLLIRAYQLAVERRDR